MARFNVTEIAEAFMAEQPNGEVYEGRRAWAIEQMRADPFLAIHVAEAIGQDQMAGTDNDFKYAVELIARLSNYGALK